MMKFNWLSDCADRFEKCILLGHFPNRLARKPLFTKTWRRISFFDGLCDEESRYLALRFAMLASTAQSISV
jgi:hypothetical protein